MTKKLTFGYIQTSPDKVFFTLKTKEWPILATLWLVCLQVMNYRPGDR